MTSLKSRALISLHTETVLADGKQWVHLLPAGRFVGVDGRGPYDASDLEGIVLASRDWAGRRQLVIDYNHQTDLTKKSGGPAPAAGWIVGLQTRDDGIWGLVEWTPTAAQQIAAREYRYISPVIAHDRSGRVYSIRRAALTNEPNLDQLTALNMAEDTMDDTEFMMRLRELLGLPQDADRAAIVAALVPRIESMQSAQPDPTKFVPIGDFQRAVAEANKLRQGIALKEAQHHVDECIRDGRILPWMRDWGISLCQANLPAFEQFIAGTGPAFSKLLQSTHTTTQPPGGSQASDDGTTAEIARNMGLDPGKFAAFRAASETRE